MSLRGWIASPLLVAAVCLGGFSCDDISRPVKDPYLRAPDNVPSLEAPKKSKKPGKKEFESWLYFLSEQRAITMREAGDLIAPRQSDAAPPEMAGFFIDRFRDRIRIIKSRKGTVPLDQEAYPDGHPAPTLLKATDLSISLLNHVVVVIGRGFEYDPSLDENLVKLLDTARQQIDLLEDESKKAEKKTP